MVKLLTYCNIACFLILTALHDANAVPIRLLANTENQGRFQNLKDKVLSKKFKSNLRAEKEDTTKPTVPTMQENRNDNEKSILEANLGLLPNNKYLRQFQKAKYTPVNYYPEKGITSTVCYGRSTVYNRPKVKKWLRTEINTNWELWTTSIRNGIVLFMGLRNQLYVQGRSEECHTRKLNRLRPYIECALKRNQRMEYMIPMYPLHQMYYQHLTTVLQEIIYH